MKLNFVTVCTDAYPIEYAEIIARQLQRKTKLDFDYFCITDRPHLVTDWATPLRPEIATQGWWNKLNLFSGSMPEGWILYLDLDIVIQDGFDEEIMWTIQKDHDIACVSDAITWMGVPFSSSMMIFKSHSQQHILERFLLDRPDLSNSPGGDQVWMGPLLQDVLFIDQEFPLIKKNLKFHIAKKTKDGRLTLPTSIDPRIKMVDCTGNPKPHQLERVPYISNNWHTLRTA